MKIIQKGVLPKDRLYEAECSICKSVLSFKKTDGTTVKMGTNKIMIMVKCPMCKAAIYKYVSE